MASNLHICKDEDSVKKTIKQAGSRIVVMHFEAEWAAECSHMNEVLALLAKDNNNAVFLRIEAEEVENVTQHYGVESVPTFVILKDLKVVEKIEGADAATLKRKVSHHASFVTPHVPPVTSQTNLEDRLKKLVKKYPVMLFMKGQPDSPQCGFSRQIVAILRDNKVQFGHFDILTDDSVRQGLKKFSDWPTYPQLYADGELIGGIDIVKELAESGELVENLPKVEDINTRLEKLTKQSPLMIFMKGHPQDPRCKFSRALMEILNPMNLKIDSFDILEDEEVRQGLKTFSDWPTFPQIYVNGEFVGGLDIIKGLKENGELESTLCPT